MKNSKKGHQVIEKCGDSKDVSEKTSCETDSATKDTHSCQDTTGWDSTKKNDNCISGKCENSILIKTVSNPSDWMCCLKVGGSELVQQEITKYTQRIVKKLTGLEGETKITLNEGMKKAFTEFDKVKDEDGILTKGEYYNCILCPIKIEDFTIDFKIIEGKTDSTNYKKVEGEENVFNIKMLKWEVTYNGDSLYTKKIEDYNIILEKS